MDVPPVVAEQRDTEALFRNARAGMLAQMTGVGSAYEPPQMPELVLRTDQQPVSVCVDRLVDCLVNASCGNTQQHGDSRCACLTASVCTAFDS